MKVIASTRVYFHSAPSNACKIKDLFMIKMTISPVYSTYDDGQEQGFGSCILVNAWETRFKVGQKLKDFLNIRVRCLVLIDKVKTRHMRVFF